MQILMQYHHKKLTTKALGLFSMLTKGASTSASFLAERTMAVCIAIVVRSLANEGCCGVTCN